MRVLFLAGSGRSGSTLVTTALGQVDGFFAAGELRYLWQRGLVDNRPCGCGRPFRECPVWTAILRAVPPVEPAGVAARLRSRLRMRNRLRVPPHPDDRAIAALVERGGPLVAILWGRDAQTLRPALGDVPVIASAHPSPLSASSGFFGSSPFSRANESLVAQGAEPVDWALPH